MSEPRCPHCQTVLPEKATFCAACGNRIEGWSTVPVGDKPESLPGGQEPTTNMQPTPSLLRAAALSKKPKDGANQSKTAQERKVGSAKDSDSAMMRSVKRPIPIWSLGLLAVAAAGLAYYLASRKPPESAAPVATVPPPPMSPAPVALPPPAAPAAEAKKPTRTPRSHRIEPLQVATKAPKKGSSGGGLPHKTVATDSKPKVDSEAAKSAVMEPYGYAPTEARPMTEAEERKQAEVSVDADGVRFVVKSHLSQVHACYERAFKETSPGGRVEIGFAITLQGAAARVRTEANTTGSDSLASCLEARIKSWQFPRPVGGDYELIYPFVFSPGS